MITSYIALCPEFMRLATLRVLLDVEVNIIIVRNDESREFFRRIRETREQVVSRVGLSFMSPLIIDPSEVAMVPWYFGRESLGTMVTHKPSLVVDVYAVLFWHFEF